MSPAASTTMPPSTHDPVDRVGARHQRRVQRVRHLRDHRVADEAGQHQDRAGSASRVLGRRRRPSVPRLPGRRASAHAALASISSSKSGVERAGVVEHAARAGPRRCARTAATRARGIVAARFSGAVDRHVVVHHGRPRVRELAVATALRRRGRRPRCPAASPPRPRRSTSVGARRPGTCAVVITTSKPVIASSSALLLLGAARPRSARGRTRPPRAARCPGRATGRRATRTCSATSGRTS